MGVEAKRDKVVVDADSSASDDDDTARLSPVRRRGSSASSDDDGAPSAAHAPLNRAVSDAEEDAFDRRDDEDDIAGTTVWYGCNMCSDFAPSLVEGECWRHLLVGAWAICCVADMGPAHKVVALPHCEFMWSLRIIDPIVDEDDAM